MYNSTANPCIIFKDSAATVAKIRLGVSYLALVLCLFAGIVMLCSKLYHTLTHRLYGYLTLANIAYSGVFTIQYFAVDLKQNFVHNVPCVIAGFLMQYTGWVVLLLTAVITFHLFVIIVHKKIANRKIEIFYILFCVGFPLLFCWIPFVYSAYGLSGNWCWIRLVNVEELNANDSFDCTMYQTGVIQKLTLWSGPMVLLVLGSSVAAVYMTTVLLIRARKKNAYDDLEKQYRALLREALPFLIFPIAFYIICIIETSFHIHYTLNFYDPDFGLWLMNAICEPIRAVPNILVLFCPGVIVMNCKRTRQVQRVLEDGDEVVDEQPASASLSRTYGSSAENDD